MSTKKIFDQRLNHLEMFSVLVGTGDHGLRGHIVVPLVVMAQIIEERRTK